MGFYRGGNKMIPLSIGLVLMVFGIILGILICIAVSTRDKKRATRDNEEAAEEIIEVLLDHGYIEDSRAENDYDLNIRKEGTRKIREILEGL